MKRTGIDFEREVTEDIGVIEIVAAVRVAESNVSELHLTGDLIQSVTRARVLISEHYWNGIGMERKASQLSRE